jgi:uncharacterized protein (DUF342 family)
MKNFKNLTLALTLIGTLSHATVITEIDSSDYAKSLKTHEAKVQKIIELEGVLSNHECEINKLKKALAKLISEKQKKHLNKKCDHHKLNKTNVCEHAHRQIIEDKKHFSKKCNHHKN